jgi:hypothetical protein
LERASVKPTKTLILRYLTETPDQTPAELAERVGVTAPNVRKHLTELHELRLARISSWGQVERGFYGPNPVGKWSLGPGRHAKKPAPKTGAQIAKDSRRRMKAPERMLARALTRGNYARNI